MPRLLKWIILALLAIALTACGSTRQSMFPPTLSVQQLRVQPDGHWHMQVRILNNSYGSMSFRRLELIMHIDNQPAARIDARFKLGIPALSADTTNVDITPSAAAQAALAAIASQGSNGTLAYSLTGTATAIPGGRGKPRQFPVKSNDWLSAVPGVANTYR
ncbi:MAG TPA: hypothetical protein VF269_04760 [Rhodanobacteraceae bacterium]